MGEKPYSSKLNIPVHIKQLFITFFFFRLLEAFFKFDLLFENKDLSEVQTIWLNGTGFIRGMYQECTLLSVVKRKCTVAFVKILTMLYIVHRYTQKFISFNQHNLFSFSITAPHPKLLLASWVGLPISHGANIFQTNRFYWEVKSLINCNNTVYNNSF